MIDTSLAGLFARFVATFLGVFIANGFFGFCAFITDKFISDEVWRTFWDMVCALTIILYVLQLAVKL